MVLPHNAVGNAQTKTHPRLPGTEKRQKNKLRNLWLDPRSGVGDGDLADVPLRPRVHFYFPAIWHHFAGVLEYIVKCLGKVERIKFRLWIRHVEITDKLNIRLSKFFFERAQYIGDCIVNRCAVAARAAAAARNRRASRRRD